MLTLLGKALFMEKTRFIYFRVKYLLYSIVVYDILTKKNKI